MPTPSNRPFFQTLGRVARGWVSRSLAVGAVATLVDIAVMLACIHFFAFPNPLAAAAGVAVGSTLAFFGNRVFAFPDANRELAPQAWRFVGTVSVGMALHASLVHVLADRFAVPVVLAKLVADLAVFGLGQLFLLRYVVFPAAAPKWLRAGDSAVPDREKAKGSAARVA